MLLRIFLLNLLVLVCLGARCQPQDVDFHLNAHLLNGQKIIKVRRDFHDTYLWALGPNNQVFRINGTTLAVEDYSAQFAAFNNLQFVDVMGCSADTVFCCHQIRQCA
jgi:hypothetical protein